jgi:hypothetical protein
MFNILHRVFVTALKKFTKTFVDARRIHYEQERSLSNAQTCIFYVIFLNPLYYFRLSVFLSVTNFESQN